MDQTFPLKFNNFIIIIKFILFTQAQLLYYCTQLVNINLFFCKLTLLGKLILETCGIQSLFGSSVQLYSHIVFESVHILHHPVITLYRSSVHLNCKTCPLLLLVLALTNGIPSKITLMNRVDQPQGLKCVTDTLTH